MRTVKLITTLDRMPNYLLDYWIRHHLKYFNSNELMFSINLIDPIELQCQLFNRYNIEADIITDIAEINTSNKCVIFKHPYSNIKKYSYFIDYSSELANYIQNNLIQLYDVVIWLDMDELLYHTNLRNVINTFTEHVIRPEGIEIVQHTDELPLNTSIPLHLQRSYIHYMSSKHKPILTRTPVQWIPGRHSIPSLGLPHGELISSDDCYPGLYLVHLDKIDIDRLKKLREDNFKIYSDFNVNFKFDNWIQECRDNLIDGNWIINKISN